MYCSPTVGLQAYREKELQTESEYDIIILIDVESTVMWSTWYFWKLRPFRLLKMSAAQGFVRVRISKFHIVLACFSCILPEQGLHLRYTESCPRGRRCDTRNRVGRFPEWPRKPLILRASSAFLHFFKTEYLRFFYALSTISTLGSQSAGNPQSLENTAWRCIEVVVTRLTRNQLTGQTVRGFESLHLRHINETV